MKQLMISLCCVIASSTYAQTDYKDFKGYIHNQEYGVYLCINFYDQDITIPGQESLGNLPDYLGKNRNSFAWPIVSVKIKGKKAIIKMINDYGSEDLEATLICQNDSTYVLHQGKGSTIKVPNDGKWQRLPQTITLKR